MAILMQLSTIFILVESGTRWVVMQSPPSLAPSSTIFGPSFVTMISVCDGPLLIPTALFASLAIRLISSVVFFQSAGLSVTHFNEMRCAGCDFIRNLNDMTFSVNTQSFYADFGAFHEFLNNNLAVP